MTFDIINITEAEVEMLDTIQLKLLRTAQEKKNELYHKLQQDIVELKLMCYSNNNFAGTTLTTQLNALQREYEYQVDIVRDQLMFSMSLREPGMEEGNPGGSQYAYPVDYRLSYLQRYIVVRDYYLSIPDPQERLVLYQQDDVAKDYLKSYYYSLMDYFANLIG